MGRKLSIISLCLFASVVIGSFTSCSNELDQFEDDQWINEATTTLATRSAGGPGDDRWENFPTLNDVRNAPGFETMANKAWDMTMNFVTDTTRCEYGFMIYWTGNKIEFGEPYPGPVVNGCGKTNGSWKANLEYRSKEICAVFHCHTPIPYCCTVESSNARRKTGCSNADKAWAKAKGIPIMAYDFKENPVYYHADFSTREHVITESENTQKRCNPNS